jgi:hypothetical protein
VTPVALGISISAQVNLAKVHLYGPLGIILKDADMTVVIGPVLKRADGYEFDTWTAGKEVARGYRYRRIEDAYYARNADIKASAQGRAPAAIVCQTLDEFIVKLTEDGYPINDVYLAAESPVQDGRATVLAGSEEAVGSGSQPTLCWRGEWIRTFSFARGSQRFRGFARVGADRQTARCIMRALVGLSKPIAL